MLAESARRSVAATGSSLRLRAPHALALSALLAGALGAPAAAQQPVPASPNALQTPPPATSTLADRGKAVYEARCSGCHSVDAHRVGPLHSGVVGRRAGALADFDYSPALRDSTLLWTRARLTAWLADPEALIPGQGMDYRLEDARERDEVVAYLATLKRLPVRAAR